jgi:hypothetical protein
LELVICNSHTEKLGGFFDGTSWYLFLVVPIFGALKYNV